MALKGEKREARVLMVAFGAIGHLNPFLRLGKLLVSKGLSVTLASTEATRKHILPSAVVDSTAGINLAFFSNGLSPDFDPASDVDLFMESTAKFGPINLSTLIEDQHRSNSKFSYIISNPSLPWVADLAAQHGIPCAMLWVQSSMLYALYYRFYNNLNDFPSLNNPDMTTELPGLPILNTQDLPSFILPSNPFTSFPKVLTELLQNTNKLKWVFGNSFDELEKNAIESMNELHPIRSVGPLVPSVLIGKDVEDVNQPKDEIMEWLDKQKTSSVIYVSFGSILKLPVNDMESIAGGLKNSKRPFLWVVKGELPPGFVEETKDRGLVVKWSPQTKVLANPSVGCFLSHCGWNSLQETVAAGVPVIAFPQWTDQPTNAKLLVDVLRVGVRLGRGRDGILGTQEVERCIEDIMSGHKSDEIRKNAADLKRAAREALADGGSSDRNIQLFVDEITAGC